MKEDVATIRKALKKKSLKHVDEVTVRGRKRYWVVFEEKGKIKAGTVSQDYYHRYGVETCVSKKKGSSVPWIQSYDVEKSLPDGLIDAVVSEDLSGYDEFDLDLLNMRW